MIDVSSHPSHPKRKLFSQTVLGTFASLYFSFCIPITPTVKPGIDTPAPMQTSPILQKKNFYSSFLKEQEFLKEAAASCNEISLGEKVTMTYRTMLQKQKVWNEREDCPEFYYEDSRPGWKAFIIARQPYLGSCITEHEKEIAEDKVRALEGRSRIFTYFHIPVSNGLEIGMGNNDPSYPQLSFAVFPDLYGKPEYYGQYTLDFDTLEITSCSNASPPAACSLLPLEKTLQAFCTVITAKEKLEQKK